MTRQAIAMPTAAVSIDLAQASTSWTGDAQGDCPHLDRAVRAHGFRRRLRGVMPARMPSLAARGNDQISGLGGDDQLNGGDGNDASIGGDGNDFMDGDGYNQAGAAPRNDHLQGDAGDDTLSDAWAMTGWSAAQATTGCMAGRRGSSHRQRGRRRVPNTAPSTKSQNIVVNGVNQLDQIVDFATGPGHGSTCPRSMPTARSRTTRPSPSWPIPAATMATGPAWSGRRPRPMASPRSTSRSIRDPAAEMQNLHVARLHVHGERFHSLSARRKPRERRDVEAAARAMGLQIQIFNASTIREIDAAFASLLRERADALLVSTDTFLSGGERAIR